MCNLEHSSFDSLGLSVSFHSPGWEAWPGGTISAIQVGRGRAFFLSSNPWTALAPPPASAVLMWPEVMEPGRCVHLEPAPLSPSVCPPKGGLCCQCRNPGCGHASEAPQCAWQCGGKKRRGQAGDQREPKDSKFELVRQMVVKVHLSRWEDRTILFSSLLPQRST